MTQSIVKHVFSRSCKFIHNNLGKSILEKPRGRYIVTSQTTFDEKSAKTDDLGHTTVILQDRLDIQELPAIVRKLKNVTLSMIPVSEYHAVSEPHHGENLYVNVKSKILSDAEEKEIVDGFNRCCTTKGVFLLLETLPDEEINPFVALQALKKIIELENNQQYRNRLVRSGEEKPENFTRNAIFSQLIDLIVSGSDSNAVIEALKVVSRDLVGGNSVLYRDKLFNETLVRVTDGKFNILQICEIVKVFYSLNHEKKTEDIDKLWVGFVDRGKDIDENNIVEFFKILPMLKQSQKMVFNMLEQRVYDMWWRLPCSTMIEILNVLFDITVTSPRIVSAISRWTNANVHTLSEDDMLAIVTGFSALNYLDEGIEKSIERYVKAKGVKVKNPALIATIMDYCAKFRLRSPHILQGCGEYFIKHGFSLSPVLIKAIFIPFGLLDFHPSNRSKFWQVLESTVDEKFIQFRPDDAIDVMLACVYLEKHPINFVKKIFNPYFLDRLHTYKDRSALQVARTKLKIFDTAMTLECTQYRGPLLPREYSSKSLWQDGRIKRTVNAIYDSIADVAGGSERVSTSVVLARLPTNELYVVDILLHPRGMCASMLNFSLPKDRNLFVAVVVHVPEHYCVGGTHLLGPQVMRHRHFRLLGLQVVSLNYDTLAKLKVHPKALREYLVERMEMAEKAL